MRLWRELDRNVQDLGWEERVMQVIDMRVRIPRRELTEHPEEFMVYYQDRAGFDVHYNATIDQLLREMDASSVVRAVLHSEWEFEDPIQLNERTRHAVGAYSDKFFGVVSVDPRRGVSQSLVDLRKAVAGTSKCIGFSLQPAFLDMLPEAARLYPLYQFCEESGIPVWLHTGINYAPNHSMEPDRPMHLERILLDFPNLKLVACHSGWPWVGELCALARKFYPRLYLEIGGVAPRYIFAQGTGWDPFLQYANTLLQDQILFGTDWPIIPFDRAVKEIQEAPLKEAVKSKILYENGWKLIMETLNKQNKRTGS